MSIWPLFSHSNSDFHANTHSIVISVAARNEMYIKKSVHEYALIMGISADDDSQAKDVKTRIE